jgi:hypothetical protein
MKWFVIISHELKSDNSRTYTGVECNNQDDHDIIVAVLMGGNEIRLREY